MRNRRVFGLAIELVETLVLTVAIFFGLQAFVAQPFRVEGRSMEQTVFQDQYVLVDKLSPRWATYARGDVVVLQPPGAPNGGVPFIKRVIGLPGDTVELRDGRVYVNGAALLEPYVFTDDQSGVTEATGGAARWVIGNGQVFVLGDHRDESSDSRIFGPVEIAHVIGRAWVRYWPIGTFEFITRPSYSATP
jgi:signal peptidase I